LNIACHGHNPILASKVAEWADRLEGRRRRPGGAAERGRDLLHRERAV